MNNSNGSTYIGTVHQHLQCFESNKPGIRRPGETQVNNIEGPGISTARLFLPYDQILTLNCMWTVT